jgi:hypothetical protein
MSTPIILSGLSESASKAKSPVPVAISKINLGESALSFLMAFLRQIMSIPKDKMRFKNRI